MEWASPGGLYVVPSDWKARFLREFPDYRVRWSLKDHQWQIEQKVGAGALPPLKIDPFDDSLIRARDGYWLVMTTKPGSRFPCRKCHLTLQTPFRKTAEVRCENCRRIGRDGRTLAGYWPFDELLLERLRFTDPLRGGIQRARAEVDSKNLLLKAVQEAQIRDAGTIDAVDYRWISGIPSTTGLRRQFTQADLDVGLS